jgi:hypothetical protein
MLRLTNIAEGDGMDEVRYPVSGGRNNTRAYRQFFGKESRAPGVDASRAKGRIKLAFLYAQAFIQRKSPTRL